MCSTVQWHSTMLASYLGLGTRLSTMPIYTGNVPAASELETPRCKRQNVHPNLVCYIEGFHCMIVPWQCKSYNISAHSCNPLTTWRKLRGRVSRCVRSITARENGCVAWETGSISSNWIGNKSNLIHMHKCTGYRCSKKGGITGICCR